MNYRLVVLTHGDCEPLLSTIDSFCENVSPLPTSMYIHVDGPTVDVPVPTTSIRSVEIALAEPARGFCGSCRAAWAEATRGGHEFVFWLEHDFRFTQPVDLEQLASVLDANPQLAQMALMRQAVNKKEWDAGGLVGSRPGQFEPRGGWLEQRAFLTTNPSLMKREFMVKNPWPDPAEMPSECEGMFGIHLREQGYSFGMWGAGEVWVVHTGARTGWGY